MRVMKCDGIAVYMQFLETVRLDSMLKALCFPKARLQSLVEGFGLAEGRMKLESGARRAIWGPEGDDSHDLMVVRIC